MATTHSMQEDALATMVMTILEATRPGTRVTVSPGLREVLLAVAPGSRADVAMGLKMLAGVLMEDADGADQGTRLKMAHMMVQEARAVGGPVGGAGPACGAGGDGADHVLERMHGASTGAESLAAAMRSVVAAVGPLIAADPEAARREANAFVHAAVSVRVLLSSDPAGLPTGLAAASSGAALLCEFGAAHLFGGVAPPHPAAGGGGGAGPGGPGPAGKPPAGAGNGAPPYRKGDRVALTYGSLGARPVPREAAAVGTVVSVRRGRGGPGPWRIRVAGDCFARTVGEGDLEPA